MSLFELLIQFLFRVTFGVALAMSVTPARSVSSGFYRIHLWVLMGLNTLAGLTLTTQRDSLLGRVDQPMFLMGLAFGLAILSYVGSACWLYEQIRAGYVILWMVAAGAIWAAILATSWRDPSTAMGRTIGWLNIVTSGWLLGVTLTAMFLGHWYLNTPTMEMRPIRQLVLVLFAAILARGMVSGAGLVAHIQSDVTLNAVFWIFVALRWLSGLLGAMLLAVMTWRTLQIPNTQSSTGILYASVVLTFIGELTSQFLSASASYPL